VRGGVDFAFSNPWWAHVTYQMNNGTDADISAMWMAALPVRYIVVPGPASSEIYRDFADTKKFDGAMPIVFDERGVRIYEVSRVGDPRLVIARVADLPAPASAIDRSAISEYVKRISAGRAPNKLEPRGLGSFRAEVEVREGEQVVLRQAYDTGWRATVDGRPANARPDAIGQLIVDVPPGRHVVELEHGVHADFIAGVAVALVTALLWLAISVRRRIRGHA
jgi:hypothetical protein